MSSKKRGLLVALLLAVIGYTVSVMLPSPISARRADQIEHLVDELSR